MHSEFLTIKLLCVRYIPGGRVMVVGCRGSVNFNPRHLMLTEASIRGVQLQNATIANYKVEITSIHYKMESASC